ncbi:respiratory nitrate reductase subunit gamma [Actinomadura mexicana]|uniref:Nitrate reductase-like protein NarX n=1 Tax=Actinomadura mexicana TaxID=134959 RepID=A0A239GL17_9ACTN|nr:respiratory nitrate reductase subunit gamma [Actinomadura mexicana]SNS69671.1 nitrate reductase gamma subunit [Actinomadura mexicana]
MFPAVSLFTIVPVLYLGLAGHSSLASLLAGGFFLGIAGATFAVGVPFVNAWFPPRRRGLAVGIFGAGMGGHVGGLLIPDRWTEAAGVTEDMYHVVAVVLGTVAGFCTLAGLAILVYRRRTVGPVFSATTRNDKLMYAVLALTILLGLSATVVANIVGDGYDYRETVSPWFRSIFYLQPDPDLMTGVPILFQLHAISALVLFGIWPFTRLVHMLTAPVGYLTRPYIVYRSRDEQLGMYTPRRGWERAS